MKVKTFRSISSIIIVVVLSAIVLYLGTSSYNYVFSYQNEDIIYNGNRQSNKVSLMINVYWGTEYIKGMLDVLDSYNAKTTFFIGGSWAEKENEMLEEIVSRGHEIASHGYFHKDHKYLSYDQNYDEIKANHGLIKAFTGMDMNLFAPPSGSFNKSTIASAKDLGYKVIMWSKDTIDWRDKDANIIFSRATSGIRGGDLILMHPTECTLKALPLILEYYKLNNISCATVSDCLK